MATISERFGAFVASCAHETIPIEVRDAVQGALLNALVTARRASLIESAQVAQRAVTAMNGENGARQSSLWGTGKRVSIGEACLANGALVHCGAQEDTLFAAHFGTVLIPLAIAMCEARQISPNRLIPALVAGYEIGGILQAPLVTSSTSDGFRATSIYGAVAAAATTSSLLDLGPASSGAAMAIAASLAGGTLQCFDDGSNEWSLQVGHAAIVGYMAAEYAKAGMLAANHAFEGSRGFANCFAKQRLPADFGEELGQSWSARKLTFKPFPVCAFNQTPVLGALALRERVDVPRILSVTVRMNPFECGYAGMDRHGPFTTFAGTAMSIPFSIATTLINGAPTVAAMECFGDEAVNSLERRITLVADDTVPTLSAHFTVETREGVLDHREERTVDDFRAPFPDLAEALAARDEDGGRVRDLTALIAALPAGSITGLLRLLARE